ncbi:MAG: hypothetical protein CVV49_13035 [Spirochaetae bacterium HGW-Spirochaetae-5]|nr:MAG: hypothetical protein CVV49_13035 [Spirochaetae bacterium HGW-Spirochaetae-5]
MKINKQFKILFLSLIIAASAGCGSTSAKWTKDDFSSYAQTKGGSKKFAFKCFATEINLKMGIICEEFLESKNSIDFFPAQEIKEYMQKKYGVVIDTSEFEDLRKNGKLKVEILKNTEGDKEIFTNKDYIAIDGMSVNTGLMGRYAIAGSSWLAANWSEYKEKVGSMDFRNKVEMGKSDQMQIFIVLAPIGSYIGIYLRVKDGEPDKNGYYKLKIVAEEELKINFKPGNCNTAGLAENIKQLPVLLNAAK